MKEVVAEGDDEEEKEAGLEDEVFPAAERVFEVGTHATPFLKVAWAEGMVDLVDK